jgi:DNA topoisomerase II
MTEQLCDVLSTDEHIRTHDMWAGSIDNVETTRHIIHNDTMTRDTITYPPALYKIIDEPLCNCVDHYLAHPNEVSYVKFHFDRATGTIIIENDGPGIPITKNPKPIMNSEGKKEFLYEPTVIFTVPYSGTKHKKEVGKITGGTNGIGLKILNCWSSVLEIETLDTTRGLHFKQSYSNRMRVINPAEIKKSKAKKSFTKLTFIPDYSAFKFITNDDNMIMLDNLFRTRITYLSIVLSDINVYYNSTKTSIKSLNNLAKIYTPDASIINGTITHPKYPIDITISISKMKEEQGIYIFNGLVCDKGSNLKTSIIRKIVSYIKKKFKTKEKSITPSMISSNMFIFMKGFIENPSFPSQDKSEVILSATALKSYDIAPEFIDKCYKAIKSILEEQIDENEDKKKNKRVQVRNIRYYDPAEYAGSKYANKCGLFLAEGDSAKMLVMAVRASRDFPDNSKYYGIFTLRGVILNSRKQTIENDDKLKRKQKLLDNEILVNLMNVLGLEYGATDASKMRYGFIMGAVDQDLDGAGNIWGLVMNFFHQNWPWLFKSNFIRRWITPVIRCYPKARGDNHVIEFFLNQEYLNWVKERYGKYGARAEDEMLREYKIDYNKGLAGHGKAVYKAMALTFNNRSMVYSLDKNDCKTIFDAYYGYDAEKRREILSKPIEDPRYNYKSKKIMCADHLDYDTNLYHRENIERKLPHYLDGLTPARRKALAGARKKFAKCNDTCVTTALGGYIQSNMKYQHGIDSLYKSIIQMTQNFAGSNNYPMFLTTSTTGSRLRGGKEKVAPRYIKVSLNKDLTDLLFPRIDDHCLPYKFEDGERAEPLYYVPILPLLTIGENRDTPATGWKTKIWARRYEDIVENVKRLINGNSELKVMEINLHKLGGEIVNIGNKQYHCGDYLPFNPKDDEIVITELPIRKWIEPFINDIMSKDDKRKEKGKEQYIKTNPSMRDGGIDENIRINIKFNSGMLQKMMDEYGNEHMDAVINFFNLKTALTTHINMYNHDGRVMSYKNYEDCVVDWFVERKKLYIIRVDRDKILTEAKICYHKNVLRFIEHDDGKRIPFKVPKNKLISLLDGFKFNKLVQRLIDNPSFLENEELRKAIYDGDYEYLMKLPYIKKTKEEVDRRMEKLKKLEEHLKMLNERDIWKKIWLSEIDKLGEVIRAGVKCNWIMNEDKYDYGTI